MLPRRDSSSDAAAQQPLGDTAPEPALPPLSTFLRAQKAGYLAAAAQGGPAQAHWTIAMGNEAGDLDSLASAVAYAWYATHRLQQPTVPLLRTRRADVALRAENLHALALSGAAADDLLTADELPAHAPPAARYALLDHNVLAEPFTADDGGARVVAVIDHHADEGRHLDAAPRVVEVPTGSCASLVARLVQREWPAGAQRGVARLLLCAVLVDTGGLRAGGKAEAADRGVAPFLLERAELAPTDASALAGEVQDVREVRLLARELVDKKESVDHLGARDLLRRDYKEYKFVRAWDTGGAPLFVGLASVPKGVKAITRGEEGGGAELVAACLGWMDERGLGVLGGKGKHRREMLWVVRHVDEEVRRRLWKGLEESKELKVERRKGKKYIEAAEGAVGEGVKVRVYEQGNAQATRKATAPLVRRIFEDSR
ncbi:hypothetical protein BC834DRAFT_923584 [Gloeopeniophorella convolvens]|nr:hypothetical protein BC834DRAFT_923584 [Gloeopeniophorella convolvens]